MKLKISAIVFLTLALLTTSCGKKKTTSSSTIPSSVESSLSISSSSSTSSSNEIVSQSSSEKIEYKDYYDGYYSSLTSWSDGEDLKEQLYKIIRNGYTPLPYASPNWESNQYADQAIDDFESVDIVYSKSNNLKTATNKNGVGWQREHAFCASLMTGKTTGEAVSSLGRATDFHNLFASYYAGNTSRGNKNYGIADKSASSYQNKTVDGGKDGYSFDSRNFEPGDYDKGRLARAIFYMGTMYQYPEGEYKGLSIVEGYISYSNDTACQYAIGNLSTLIKWNELPVDRLEYQHNLSVYTHKYEGVAQGNRNPFVDYPELVDYVYGWKKTKSGKLSDLTPSAYYLEIDSKTHSNYALSTAKRDYKVGETVKESDYSLVDVAKDYSYSPVTLDTISSPYTFTESDGKIGTKELTILTPDGPLNYSVAVESASLSSCKYVYTFENKSVFGETGSKILASGSTVDLGGLSWTFSYSSDVNSTSIPVSNNATFGIQIGTGSSNNWANSLTMKLNTPLSGVKAIYIKANTASGSTYYMNVSCGSFVSSSISIVRNADASQIYGTKFSPVDGEVSINIKSVNKAFYLQQIGVDYGE